MSELSGNIRKLVAVAHQEDGALLPRYSLPLGSESLELNDLVGHQLRLRFEGGINCIACGRKTNKSFNQGYCFPCVRRLAECDICIVSPEKCHYDQGTCRDPEWADTHCMQSHIVYLSNTSGVKVGITRHSQVPTRWIDQGASQALPIFRVKSRYHSGLIEAMLKQHVADRTDWRRMLKGDAERVDLGRQRDELLERVRPELDALQAETDEIIQPLQAEEVWFRYPVSVYPEKIKSLNFDKTAELGGILHGIKGQYLVFDTGVLNIRKFGGYHLTVSFD